MPPSTRVGSAIDHMLNWAETYLLSYSAAVELVLVTLAFIAAGALYRMVSPHMKDRVAAMSLAPVFKLALHNLRKLVFPMLALSFLFVMQLLAHMGLLDSEMVFIGAAINLLLAWIVIRLALQFIRNGFMRNMLGIMIWGMAALSIVGVLDDMTTALSAVGFSIGEARISGLSVAKAVLAVFVLLYVAGIVSAVLDRRIQKMSSLSASARLLLGKTTKMVLIGFAVLTAIATAGIDLSLLAVFSGAVGLGIGFGLQRGVSNLFSGMLLLLDKSISPGDIIELPGGAFGWVNQMSGRYTEIVTRDNKAFLVPNEHLASQQVINWSHMNRLIRTEVNFGVSYDSDPHLVLNLAEEACRNVERVVNDPPPACHLVEFGDFALRFKMRFWIRDPEKGMTNIHGEVMMALWDVFRDSGIKIPYPRQDVFIRAEQAPNGPPSRQ